MRKEIIYKKQGNGQDSWSVKVLNGDELVESYLTLERPYNWGDLRVLLMQCSAFKRILSNLSLVNLVAYGALQTVLSTESNEQHLLEMLKYTMEYTALEKEEINKILLDNYFTVQL